ncbi:hypothetical protein [Paenibacillus sp. FSL K6-1230]|uniref:hypothetical protein n=1 Tax=Paenibacillus sp. FSL K6-1230 TaxID=2921603 RepID=UPI0030F4B7D2
MNKIQNANWKNKQSRGLTKIFGQTQKAIERKSQKNFWNPDYSPEFLEVKIQSVSIKYSNYPDFNYNHVVVDIPIRYRGENIGLHRVLFSFDGEIADDFYFFD